MSKELDKALECLEKSNAEKIMFKQDYDTIKQALTQPSKEEQAFKIIKEKNVDVYLLKTSINLEHYNSEIRLKNYNNTYSYEVWYELTEQEYNLLKEVL